MASIGTARKSSGAQTVATASEAASTVYYAHALCVYDTPCERKELKLIRAAFAGCRIVNPSRYQNHSEENRDNFHFWLGLVEKCDVVVYTRVLGKITAGVGKEVNHALKLGKPVYELTAEGVVRRLGKVKCLDRIASRRLYRKWWDERGGN